MKPGIVILSAFATPFRSGAEACAEEVAARLRDRFDITIVTARMRRDLPEKDHLPSGVPVIRVGIGSSVDKWLYPFLAPLAARKLRPQIIHAILETFAGLALCFCRFFVPGAKRILTLQTTNRSFLKGFVIRSADAVTAISSVLVTQAKTLGRADVTLIPNGVDVVAMHRATSHHAKVPGRILSVGRLEPMKGVDTLLRAFAVVARDRPEANLRIVGDGSQRRALEALSRALGLTDRVSLAGYVPSDKLFHEYAAADIFCGLSRSEAMGNVFLEAQAAGCAVVGTTVGGIPEIVREGGILVIPDDSNAAAEALHLLLADASLRRTLSEKGRKHAEAFDWNGIAEKYATVYQAFIR